MTPEQINIGITIAFIGYLITVGLLIWKCIIPWIKENNVMAGLSPGMRVEDIYAGEPSREEDENGVENFNYMLKKMLKENLSLRIFADCDIVKAEIWYDSERISWDHVSIK